MRKTSLAIASSAAAFGLLLSAAAPASANTTVGVPTIDLGADDLRPLSATGTATVLARNPDGTRTATYGCSAQGGGDIVAINVSCSYVVNGGNFDSVSITLPGAGGAASAAGNAVISGPSGSLKVCWRATGYYLNGESKELPVQCSTISTFA